MEIDRLFYVCYWLVFAVLSSEVTSASPDVCVDHGYTPMNGYREPIASRGYKFFPGSVIRYYCDQHFELRPTVTIQKCNASETLAYTWSPELPPKCVKLLTCSKPAIPHATIDKDAYYKGDGLFVICDNGYTLAQYNSSVCLETGQWSHLPKCKENHCPFPTSIGHGFYTFYPPIYDVEDVPPDSLVHYTCNEGYELDPINQQRRDCREGQWTGNDPKCIREGCDPPDAALGDYLPKREYYDVRDTLTYICHLDYDITRSCQPDHTWSGTPCPQTLTTKQMPVISSQHTIYCQRSWPNDDHQKVKCCIEDSIGSDGIDHCCPERGLVEFVCDDGYTLRGKPSQWMCSHTEDWVAVESNGFETMVDTPKCYRNETGRTGSGAVSDDVLKPVLGTAAGVLIILSVAIIIAFCRPKLIDMKRRWRELREDEDELIIDGRRILLPSYEEAVTSQDPSLQQPPFPSSTTTHCENDVPGPSHWHNIRRTRTPNSANSTRARPRPSYSSDEEMLLPEALKTESDKNNSSRPQSLVLKAGTLVDACVIINPQPSEQMISNTNTDKQYDQLPISEVSQLTSTGRSFLDLKAGDDPTFVTSNDSEVNLESIYPKALSQTKSKMQIKPAISDDGNHLLSYPLISVDDLPEIEIHIGSNETTSDSEETLANVTEECTAAQKPTEKPDRAVKDEDSEKEDPQQTLLSPEQIHIVMSSQSMDHRPHLDEMGSTAV